MKKTITLLLALTLCLSLCVPALAAPVGSESGDVIISVDGVAGEGSPVYYVTFQWGSLQFTYDFKETAKTWDPNDHDYDITTEGTAGWDRTGAEVTVVNHSNAAVTVSASFNGSGAGISSNGVSAVLTNTDYTIPSAVGTTFANAPRGVTTVTVSGAPADKSGFTLGTIVVSVGAA